MAGRGLALALLLVLGCARAKDEAKAPEGVSAHEERDEPWPDPHVDQILGEMYRVYQELPWYSDQGEVITEVGEPGDPHPFDGTIRFRTHFVRPDRFHFEFDAEPSPDTGRLPHRYKLWWNGKEATTWWSMLRRWETGSSLEGAIAGATGVSGGAALTMPSLLLGVLGRPKWGNPRLVGREEKLGRDCFVIELSRTVDLPSPHADRWLLTRVWLDTEAHLIRRIREEWVPATPPYRPADLVQVTSFWPDIETRPPEDVFQPDGPNTKAELLLRAPPSEAQGERAAVK